MIETKFSFFRVDLPDEEKSCPFCGTEYEPMGVEAANILHLIRLKRRYLLVQIKNVCSFEKRNRFWHWMNFLIYTVKFKIETIFCRRAVWGRRSLTHWIMKRRCGSTAITAGWRLTITFQSGRWNRLCRDERIGCFSEVRRQRSGRVW